MLNLAREASVFTIFIAFFSILVDKEMIDWNKRSADIEFDPALWFLCLVPKYNRSYTHVSERMGHPIVVTCKGHVWSVCRG